MPNFKKSSNFSPTPNYLIAILCTIFIIIIVLLSYNPYSKIKNFPPAPAIAGPDYMNSVQTWQDPADGSSYQTNGVSLTPEMKTAINNTSDFQLYIYDNPTGFFKKPDINTVFDDLLQGLNYQSTNTPPCYQSDELYVRRSKRKCLSDGINCYSVFGNKIELNQEEIFTEMGDIKPCTDFLGNITFNFLLGGDNIIDPKTKFLDIEALFCSKNNYDKQIKVVPFYKDIDFFIADQNLVPSDDYYLPQMTNSIYKPNSLNQKFIIRRYNWDTDKKKWVLKPTGVFAAIILKAGNLYMTAQVFSGTISQIQNVDTSSLDGKTNYINVPVVEGTNQTARVSLIYDTDKKQYNLSVVNSGLGYKNTGEATINLGNGKQIPKLSLIIKDDYKIIFKEIADDTELETVINWVLIPPLDFTPGKVDIVTKFNTSSNKILNQYDVFVALTGIMKKNGQWNPKNLISFDSNNLVANQDSGKISKDSVFLPLTSNLNTYNNGNLKTEVEGWESDSDNDSDDQDIQNIDPDFRSYPKYKYQCVLGGAPNDQIDFGNGYNLTASKSSSGIFTNSTWSNTITFNPGLSLSNYDKPGELISDNEVIWKVRHFDDNITVFDSGYFVNATVGPGVKTAGHLTPGAVYGVAGGQTRSIYREGVTGFIATINIDNISYNSEALVDVGSIPLVLNSDNTENFDSGNGDAELFITVLDTQTNSGRTVGNIQSIDIIKAGSGYKDSTFSIKIPNVPAGANNDNIISNIVITTQDIIPIFKAVPVDASGKPETIRDTSSSITEGLVVSGLNITNQGLRVSSEGLSINFAGYNYRVGQQVYLNQIYNNDTYINVPPNNNGIPTSGYETGSFDENNLKYLASLKIESVEQPGLVASPSNHNLNRIGIPENQRIISSDIEYNYYVNDQRGKQVLNNNSVYSPSPQQIGFLETTPILNGQSLKDIMKANISDNRADNFYDLFLAYKDREYFTQLTQLKTLQFPELNYISIDYNNKEDLFPNILENNKLNPRDQLILGRFIPYSVFAPPVRSSSDKDVPTQDPAKIFYNNNSTQIINYGLQNIFEVPVKATTLNTF